MCIRDRRIARETTGNRSEELKHVLSGEEIIFYQDPSCGGTAFPAQSKQGKGMRRDYLREKGMKSVMYMQYGTCLLYTSRCV